MNIIHEASGRAFQRQQFATADKTPVYYEAITIATSSIGKFHQERTTIPGKEIYDFVRKPSPPDCMSFFRLVSFDWEDGIVMKVTRELFNDVFSAFGLDECCRYLTFKRAVCVYIPPRRGPLQSVYLGLKSCKVLYTYNTETRSTNAIVIQDTPSTLNPMVNLPIQICQGANLASHPCFLPCVSAVCLMLFTRTALREALGGVVIFGKALGVDVWTSNVLAHDLTTSEQLLKLGNMIDLMEPILGELDYVRRFMNIAEQVQEGMASEEAKALASSVQGTGILEAEEEIKEVMRMVKSQMEAEKKIMNYWTERGRSQINTVFNMINRGDVLASIQLAKAASKDSSAMKIIAVMTMVFLPATFFAALFAVPSLRWDEERIVSERFWIYWAFTLPTTALVFMFEPLAARFDEWKRSNYQPLISFRFHALSQGYEYPQGKLSAVTRPTQVDRSIHVKDAAANTQEASQSPVRDCIELEERLPREEVGASKRRKIEEKADQEGGKAERTNWMPTGPDTLEAPAQNSNTLARNDTPHGTNKPYSLSRPPVLDGLPGNIVFRPGEAARNAAGFAGLLHISIKMLTALHDKDELPQEGLEQIQQFLHFVGGAQGTRILMDKAAEEITARPGFTFGLEDGRLKGHDSREPRTPDGGI
ncbi:Notoamide biosynthesis cluster protein M' [Paramyrothecium foliicola]|nr:Notoamide biosynthesis cluster protein M' [Paramyrothecium foliicola]